MERRLTHTFDASPSRFWQLYMLDRDFLEQTYRSLALSLDHFEVEEEGAGDTHRIRRLIRLTPQREMPGFLKKLVKGSTQVTQEEQYDAAAGQMRLKVQVPVIGDRLDYGALYTWKSLSDERFERSWEGHCVARIPLVGRKIEAYFLDEMAEGVEQMVPFLKESLA